MRILLDAHSGNFDYRFGESPFSMRQKWVGI
jgi:hypothetical protein